MAHHGIDVPGTLVARDDPHDFTYRHSDGSELLLEIVSFSDRAGNWAVVEAERRLMDALRDAGIANSSIAILPQGMSTRAISSLMRSIQSQPIERNVDDQWLQERMAQASATKQPALFLLPDKTGTRHNLLFNVRRPLLETVRESIEAKVMKAYPRAAEMVLIVDEQSTQHSPIDFNNAWDDLILACQQYPFREIHLYSGYYSNDDGLGAEFSLFTLKSVVNPHVGNVLKRGRCHSFHA